MRPSWVALSLAVVSTEAGGDDCLDSVEVVLQRPLGSRDLVDLTSGRTIPVRVLDGG